MSDKAEKKSSRRNSVRKLFGGALTKDVSAGSQDPSTVSKSDLTTGSEDDGTMSQGGDKKSKSKLRRLSKSLSKEFAKSPVGLDESEEKATEEKKPKEKRMSKRLSLTRFGDKERDKGEDNGEEVASVKEKKGKLHRLSRSISKEFLGFNKTEANKEEPEKKSSRSSSRSRALSESQLNDTTTDKKKKRGRSLSARLSGAFGNILHLNDSGDHIALIEDVQAITSTEMAITSTTGSTALTATKSLGSTNKSTPPQSPKGSKSESNTVQKNSSSRGTTPRGKASATSSPKPSSDNLSTSENTEYCTSQSTIHNDEEWTEEMDEEYKKQKKTLAQQLAREASSLVSSRKSGKSDESEIESTLREMRFNKSEVDDEEEEERHHEDKSPTKGLSKSLSRGEQTTAKSPHEQDQPTTSEPPKTPHELKQEKKQQKEAAKKQKQVKQEEQQPVKKSKLNRLSDTLKKSRKPKKADPEPEPETTEEENEPEQGNIDGNYSEEKEEVFDSIASPNLEEPTDTTYKFIILGDSSGISPPPPRGLPNPSSNSSHFNQVGKTHIVSRITDPSNVPSKYQPTISMEMHSRVYAVGGKRVRVNFWDTAGQERYKAITRQYYKGSQGVLLVFSVTDVRSFASVQSWLTELQDISDEAIVILVGNKSDLTQDRKVDREDAQEIAESLGLLYIETSALTGSNINKSAQLLLESVYLLSFIYCLVLQLGLGVHEKFYSSETVKQDTLVIGEDAGSESQPDDDGCPCG